MAASNSKRIGKSTLKPPQRHKRTDSDTSESNDSRDAQKPKLKESLEEKEEKEEKLEHKDEEDEIENPPPESPYEFGRFCGDISLNFFCSPLIVHSIIGFNFGFSKHGSSGP